MVIVTSFSDNTFYVIFCTLWFNKPILNVKRLTLLSIGMTAFLVQSAFAQTILYNESWENTQDGWGIVSGANMTLGGFSTTTGVTEGGYSLILDGPAAANSSGNGPAYQAQLGSTASTQLTYALANASSITMNVYVPAGDFGYYLQWDLAIDQEGTGGLGYQSLDGYSYSQDANIGGEATLTWTVPNSFQATLAANPTLATSMVFQIGGGFTSASDAAYLDNLTITETPEPSTIALAGLGIAGWMAIRHRKV